MKIYIVNLPQCHERRESILAECARFGLEAEIFSAVDGRALPEAEFRQSVFEPDRNPLSRPEAGCALSHLGIYRDMVEKGIPRALILEDDSVFTADPRPLLDGMERMAAGNPDVFLLTHGNYRYISGEHREIGGIRFHRGWDAFSAYGYVIEREAAANLLHFQTPVKCACDLWKMFQMHTLIRFYIAEKRIVGMHPELGSVPASLLARDRILRSSDNHRYLRRLRRQVPLHHKIRYILQKLRYAGAIRRQEG